MIEDQGRLDSLRTLFRNRNACCALSSLPRWSWRARSQSCPPRLRQSCPPESRNSRRIFPICRMHFRITDITLLPNVSPFRGLINYVYDNTPSCISCIEIPSPSHACANAWLTVMFKFHLTRLAFQKSIFITIGTIGTIVHNSVDMSVSHLFLVRLTANNTLQLRCFQSFSTVFYCIVINLEEIFV